MIVVIRFGLWIFFFFLLFGGKQYYYMFAVRLVEGGRVLIGFSAVLPIYHQLCLATSYERR